MKIVIVGCGRVGSTLAESLDAAGHEVIIFDVRTAAFDRLPETFKGSAVRGDGTDEELLRQNGAGGADIFLSLTEGDNRNIMAAQVALENLAIPQVIAKINDPVRAAAYSELGVTTICRTNLMVGEISGHLDLGIQAGSGIAVPDEAHRHAHLLASQTADPGTGNDGPGAAGSSRAGRYPAAVRPDTGRTAAGPAGHTASGQTAGGSHEASAVRTQRLGFRRWGL